jgi:hypothetical protein
VAVSPGVVDATDPVTLTSSGFPDGVTAVVLCDADAEGTADVDSIAALCGLAAGIVAQPGQPVPAEVRFGVPASVETLDGTGRVQCAGVADGCLIGLLTLADQVAPTELRAIALTPIVVRPLLRSSPLQQRRDGDLATVTVEDYDPPSGWRIAQCDRDYVEDETPGDRADHCGPAVALVRDPSGDPAAEIGVSDPLVTAEGDPVPCGRDGCALVLSDAGRPVAAHLGVSFGAPTISVRPATDLIDPAPVELAVSGAPFDEADRARVAYCELPVGAAVEDGECRRFGVPVDPWGTGTDAVTAEARWIRPGGAAVDCRASRCGYVLHGSDGAALAEAPVTFVDAPDLVVAPSTGLRDGQAMTVTGRRLPPGGYMLRHCAAHGCDAGEVVEVGPSGDLDVTFPAVQGFTATSGEPVQCRSSCRVDLRRMPLDPGVTAPYSMAAGELAATPDRRLADGQVVDVEADGLMSTYAGPSLMGFATGEWALTQCDAAVQSAPHLLGVFTHCSAPPPTQPVTVAGSTLDAPLAVRSTITRILGGTTDCTAYPGACVVGLVRFERDGSLSTHLVPVAFG